MKTALTIVTVSALLCLTFGQVSAQNRVYAPLVLDREQRTSSTVETVTGEQVADAFNYVLFVSLHRRADSAYLTDYSPDEEATSLLTAGENIIDHMILYNVEPTGYPVLELHSWLTSTVSVFEMEQAFSAMLHVIDPDNYEFTEFPTQLEPMASVVMGTVRAAMDGQIINYNRIPVELQDFVMNGNAVAAALDYLWFTSTEGDSQNDAIQEFINGSYESITLQALGDQIAMQVPAGSEVRTAIVIRNQSGWLYNAPLTNEESEQFFNALLAHFNPEMGDRPFPERVEPTASLVMLLIDQVIETAN